MKTHPKKITSEEADKIGVYIHLIQQWGVNRNITGPKEQGDMEGQSTKLIEEAMEVREGVFELRGAEAMYKCAEQEMKASAQELKNQIRSQITDGIGDTMVVCIQLCALHGISVIEALEQAWNEIKNRKGQMIKGTFVKEYRHPCDNSGERFCHICDVKLTGNEGYNRAMSPQWFCEEHKQQC